MTEQKRSIDIVLEKLQVNKSGLARKLEVDPATITQWTHRRDGLIPQKYHAKLIEIAKEMDKPLDWKDLSAV